MSELLEHIPKYIKIKENIRREIEEGLLKDGQKLASESVLIERFKVSKMTIIHALQELVDEGYLRREQGKGTFVTYSGRRPCFIAVLLTPIDMRPLSIFMEGIETAASRLGCELAYFIMREDKTSSRALVDRLAILKTTGAIVYPVGDSTNLENYRRWFHKLMKYEIPMVILDFKSHESVGASLIQTNNEKAMAELTRKVIEQGHRRLLLIRTDKRIHLNAAARINGFLQAVYQNIDDVECFHILSYNENESMETKRRTVQAFLDEFRPKRWFFGHFHLH
ncbi:MAG: GntR family transcriptional regulator, partial [Candidatus Hinthialibacter sp.]